MYLPTSGERNKAFPNTESIEPIALQNDSLVRSAQNGKCRENRFIKTPFTKLSQNVFLRD